MEEQIVIDYSPFTEEEFMVIKAEMGAMGYYLPKDGGAQRKIWENCTKIKPNIGAMPSCTCKSQTHRWIECVEEINRFIKSKE
jgi:hypothetical protein